MTMICGSCDNFDRPVERAGQYEAIARLYDGYPGNYLDDVIFFAEEAKSAGSPVLEVGVGTGRLAFCLAAVGIDVIGFDSSPAMLEVLREKRPQVGGEPERVHVFAADMRTFALRQKFSLAIVPFRTFLYLLTPADQQEALVNIRRHLAAAGRLILSFFTPPPQLLARGRTECYEMARFPTFDGDGEIVATDWAEFREEGQRLISHISYEWRSADGTEMKRLSHELEARYIFPAEVPPLLEKTGYRVIAAYGGFDRSPLREDSHEQIWVAEAYANESET